MPTCPEFIQFVGLKLFLPYFSSSLCCLSLVYSCTQSCTEVLVHLEPTAISISSTACLVSSFLGPLALLPRRLSAITSPDSGRSLISVELSLPVSSPSFLRLFILSLSKCLLFQLGLEFLTTNYLLWFEIPFLLLWLQEVLGFCIIYESWDKLCMYMHCTKHKHTKYMYLVVMHCIDVHVSMKWSVLHHYPFSRQLIKLSLQLA